MISKLCHDAVLLVCAALLSGSVCAADGAASDAGKKSTQDATKALPTDQAVNAEVDSSFVRWSAAWMFDRYLPSSARATERGLTGDTYVVRGLFDFARSGQKITIPFAAAYKKSNDKYTLSNLCYNDVSSGMTDCINPQDSLEGRRAAVTQSRQLLGAIVLVGLVAAMSDAQGETCVKRYTFFGEPYFECE
jgi:hypothetical protein